MPKLKRDRQKAADFLAGLNATMKEFEITTSLRQAAFLASLAEESDQLTAMEEHESSASGPDFEKYEDRADLGNTEEGDGKLYRGRGALQITGRKNYRDIGNALGIKLEDSPDLAMAPQYTFRIAGYYWKVHNINKWADRSDFLRVSYAINGWPKRGSKRLPNGWELRQKYYRRALRVLTGALDPTEQPAHKQHHALKVRHSNKHRRHQHGKKHQLAPTLTVPPLR